MLYKARDFTKLAGTMPGLSENLIKNHLTLYEGYVNNCNKILDILDKKGKDATNPEYAEVKRRLAFEFDGIRMHELYFDNLGGKQAINKGGDLTQELNKYFANYANWEEDFKTTGKMRGVGWVVLYQDDVTGNLLNVWINEHQDNHLVGCRPLLVMDVWEHAFMLDYGLKRADYIDAFFKNINWDMIENRLSISKKAETLVR